MVVSAVVISNIFHQRRQRRLLSQSRQRRALAASERWRGQRRSRTAAAASGGGLQLHRHEAAASEQRMAKARKPDGARIVWRDASGAVTLSHLRRKPLSAAKESGKHAAGPCSNSSLAYKTAWRGRSSRVMCKAKSDSILPLSHRIFIAS